jgi:cysteine desulfurase
LLPQILGGGQERGLRSGTENVPLIVAFGEALQEAQYLRTKDGDDNEVNRLIALRTRLHTLLQEAIPSIVFYGSFEKGERIPNNINCRIPGLSSEEVILRLDAKGFAVSHKSACASESESGSHVILALGEDEIAASENIRITMGRSTKEGDVIRLVSEMREIAERYAKQ